MIAGAPPPPPPRSKSCSSSSSSSTTTSQTVVVSSTCHDLAHILLVVVSRTPPLLRHLPTSRSSRLICILQDNKNIITNIVMKISISLFTVAALSSSPFAMAGAAAAAQEEGASTVASSARVVEEAGRSTRTRRGAGKPRGLSLLASDHGGGPEQPPSTTSTGANNRRLMAMGDGGGKGGGKGYCEQPKYDQKMAEFDAACDKLASEYNKEVLASNEAWLLFCKAVKYPHTPPESQDSTETSLELAAEINEANQKAFCKTLLEEAADAVDAAKTIADLPLELLGITQEIKAVGDKIAELKGACSTAVPPITVDTTAQNNARRACSLGDVVPVPVPDNPDVRPLEIISGCGYRRET